MKAVIPATPFAHTAELQNTFLICDEGEDRKNRSWLHDTRHLAQSGHGIGEEMKGAATEGGAEEAVFERKGIHARPGEMHVADTLVGSMSGALAKYLPGCVDPEHLPRGCAMRRPKLPVPQATSRTWSLADWTL